MDRTGPYLFIWCLVVLCLMISFGGLEAFLMDDLNDQINGAK